MKYSMLFFDLDNTLLDFDAIEKVSLPKVFAHFGVEDIETALSIYYPANQALWLAYEKGNIAIDMLFNYRFSNTMRQMGQEVDGEEWDKYYHSLLREGIIMVDGADEVLQKLSQGRRIFVLTNGVKEMQEYRLHKAGLAPYIEATYASREIGHQKPSPLFFDYVKERIGGFDQSQVLMIGDSVHTDILGGNTVGIDTCWLNRKGLTSEIPSTYCISRLTDLYNIV